MKIFNWVHRRFNNRVESVKKNDDVAGEDQQFAVENKCNYVFERWRGGILAIGTLGYDPLKDEDQQFNDYFYHASGDVSSEDETSDDSDDDELESDEEEEGVAAYSYNAYDCVGSTEMEENWKWNHEFEYVRMKKERITLADLFHADPQHNDVVLKKQPINKADFIDQKSNRKHRQLFRNKLIAKDARPIHKLNQLMRRILKRKIHPDVGPITSKVGPGNSKTCITDDYASLLPTDGKKI